MLESERQYECGKCKKVFSVQSDVEQFNTVPKPLKCMAPSEGIVCNSTKFNTVSLQAGDMPESCQDYQEIKIQEQVNKLAIGSISFLFLPEFVRPNKQESLTLLKDDLVDLAKSGDDVTITGIVMRRWKHMISNERCDIELILFANHVFIHNEQRVGVGVTDELKAEFEAYWSVHDEKPMTGRNNILASFCPQVFGLYVVKLAVMLVLIGGVQKVDKSGLKVRGESHLLLVGDPGTGKSQFLKYAAKLVPRSILTTGIGSSSAGLTVTAVRDGGEWQLEAGALVLADRGLCCIDEFGSIREHDKTAIHEAMEQQAISIAKAGIVCKLNTRCSVLAATNPKGKYDPEQSISINVALASPLLSRFDLVLVLLDSQNDEWDRLVSSFILETETEEKVIHSTYQGSLWNLEKLQAYIQYVKSSFQPKLTPESELVLSRYYQMQRQTDSRNAARTTIRLLESLIRLSQAHARLRSSDQVTIMDAVVVVTLLEASMQSSALLGPTSTLHAAFPKDPEEEYFKQEKVILRRLGLNHLISSPEIASQQHSQDDTTENHQGPNTQKPPLFPRQPTPTSESPEHPAEEEFATLNSAEWPPTPPRNQTADPDDNLFELEIEDDSDHDLLFSGSHSKRRKTS
ncbi:MCM-domain-containing protein [Basidiobolus meristosporus CBS 931.73]|uniref:MCM-domain-containing protein n=1 Tax=Basidiobolus meristosporus CBS 931.73 TaxID=1314790 RepID=A0A1Y1Y4K0_9FUNG|nr:MCM-domain-containing protein [Basidiobolus meristosporus CBS 931.73]|eukprot:ORX92913.1 MCM-domain-containing protein [Basidiobolus meristosporus CBS 931.73]